MLLKPEELEDIARRMEANRDVVVQIDELVRQQGQKLDIIESRIMFAHKNVQQANEHLEEANILSGGNPNMRKTKSKPVPNQAPNQAPIPAVVKE